MKSLHTSPRPAVVQHQRSLHDMHQALAERGWWFAAAPHALSLSQVCAELGHPLQTTEVRSDASSRSLVCSRRGLGAHTDHYRASYIAWRCEHASEHGGTTFVVDPFAVLDALDIQTTRLVSSCRVMERRIFADDPEDRPIVETSADGRRIYFTFWFARPTSPAQEQAVERYRLALDQAPPVFAERLQPGDLLVIDNRRLLHGREAFEGPRHLTRVWISDASWTPTWL